MPTTLVTDLDRTLFPNGIQPDDGALDLLGPILRKSGMHLVFATGRNLSQIEDGIRQYTSPEPAWAIAEVGTRFYERNAGKLVEDDGFIDYIRESTRGWDLEAFRKTLASLPVRLQPDENQNRFKLSYFVDDLGRADEVRAEAAARLQAITPDAHLIWSVEETENRGLLDVLPNRANKRDAIEYFRRRQGIPPRDIIYCGDSGNDLLPLTHGYRAILVANASDEVRREVEILARKNGTLDRIYFAAGVPELGLNGCYASGIVEGLRHFGLTHSEDWPRLKNPD